MCAFPTFTAIKPPHLAVIILYVFLAMTDWCVDFFFATVVDVDVNFDTVFRVAFDGAVAFDAVAAVAEDVLSYGCFVLFSFFSTVKLT